MCVCVCKYIYLQRKVTVKQYLVSWYPKVSKVSIPIDYWIYFFFLFFINLEVLLQVHIEKTNITFKTYTLESTEGKWFAEHENGE